MEHSTLVPGRHAAAHLPRIREFFLARQPILNRDGTLYAYELLFRSAAAGPASVTDDLAATAAVIAHASELGMENVIGASLAFINVNAEVLFSDFVHVLPRDTVVLEVLETVDVTNALITRIAHLADAGYRFALDDVVADGERLERILPLVDIIKIDVKQLTQPALRALTERLKREGKRLLAEKVETPEQFRTCLDLGFDYFQGYYFAKPSVLAGRKLAPAQAALVRLMVQVVSGMNTEDLERTIKQDAALGLALLRLVNALPAGSEKPVDSLGQALQLIGPRQLQRWLQILVYAEPGATGAGTSPLLMTASTRGRLLERIAETVHPGERTAADCAFTVGVMSLMDVLLASTMEEALEGLPVAPEIREALLERKGPYGDMLQLAESIEHVEDDAPKVAALLDKLGLSAEDFNALQLEAFEWSGALAHIK
ncbi:MAG TPA: EAL domain-containing protein [Noviherbaspirillum sp.]|nr:EAL domain-containing protein [Noviherbaspirillum sp.]